MSSLKAAGLKYVHTALRCDGSVCMIVSPTAAPRPAPCTAVHAPGAVKFNLIFDMIIVI